MDLRLGVLAAVSGCAAGPAAVTAPTPAVNDPDTAYVVDDAQLVEVTATGSKPVAPGADWCAVDARAQVVWLGTAAGLSAFDLVDRKVHPIIAQDLSAHLDTGETTGTLTPIIQWGGEQLGGEDSVAFDVGIALAMQPQPALALKMGCDGDRAVYCFHDGDDAKPMDDIIALKKLAGTIKLADPAYVASLAARGAGGALYRPLPPSTGTPHVAVDPANCHAMPETCGERTPIPQSPLSLVVTDNDRGDYFDEDRALFDAKTGEYVRIADGKLVRSTKPPTDSDRAGDYGGLRVSPHGVMSINGAVFDATQVRYVPKTDGGRPALGCGFAGGGWRMPGPRG